jgi:hypothetical protein
VSDGGKKGRKIGRNKKSPSMKSYPNRAIKNKTRKSRTHLAEVRRKAEKIANRIAQKKPVHKKHLKGKSDE